MNAENTPIPESAVLANDLERCRLKLEQMTAIANKQIDQYEALSDRYSEQTKELDAMKRGLLKVTNEAREQKRKDNELIRTLSSKLACVVAALGAIVDSSPPVENTVHMSQEQAINYVKKLNEGIEVLLLIERATR